MKNKKPCHYYPPSICLFSSLLEILVDLVYLFCTMSKKQKNLSFIVGFQHVHNSPCLARDRRLSLEKTNTKAFIGRAREVVQVAVNLDASSSLIRILTFVSSSKKLKCKRLAQEEIIERKDGSLVLSLHDTISQVVWPT